MCRHQECHCGGEGEGRAAKDGCGCSCGCGCGESTRASLKRRFQTKDEQIDGLENYLRDLNTETQAVEERLASLRA